MAFQEKIKEHIYEYCQRHLPSDEWYNNEFDFIQDKNLQKWIIVEFKNVRQIYKIFEGLAAWDELLLAEVRLQISMYASIYEAVLQYMLFDEYYKDDVRVKALLIQNTCKPYSIPAGKFEIIKDALNHDGKCIIPHYSTSQKRDVTKIRFDEKCKVAEEIGLIESFTSPKRKKEDDAERELVNFRNELNSIYET